MRPFRNPPTAIRLLFRGMNTAIMFILATLLSSTLAQDIETITYSDWYKPSGGSSVQLPMLPKTQRVNKHSASIVTTNDNLDEQVRKVFDYAASVWGACILHSDSVFIEIRIADIEEDIRTEVLYKLVNGAFQPLSFIYRDYIGKRDIETPDGIITINSNTVWDYSLSNENFTGGKNLAFGIMRSIARILGFGSTVQLDESGNYRFGCKRDHSLFDNLISNSSGIMLSSIKTIRGNPNPALKSYIETPGETFWINTSKGRFQLQSPPFSGENPPFVFITDNNSLMTTNFNAGSYILQVDPITQSVLNELGWNIKSTPIIKIVSNDIEDTGLASAYTSHSFRIEKGNASVQNPKWEFILPLADGTLSSMILKDNNLSCNISPIADETKYKINSDGDIEGVLHFSCTINGKEVKATPFKIFLELKPFIEYALIEKIVDNTPYDSYNAHYRVKYRGADRIKVVVEEEYSSVITPKYLYEPYIATGVADYITAPFCAWIDFTAENKYGKSVYTIELQPYGEVASYSSGSNAGIEQTLSPQKADGDDSFAVYDINGYYLGTYKTADEIDNLLYKGLLIVQHFRNCSMIRTFKKISR